MKRLKKNALGNEQKLLYGKVKSSRESLNIQPLIQPNVFVIYCVISCDGAQYGSLRGIMRRLAHLPHPIATFTSNTYCANIDIRSGGTWPEKKALL